MKETHHMRYVGYSIIVMAVTLGAIAALYVAIGQDVLFADRIQRENQQEYNQCLEKNMQGPECEKFLKQQSVKEAAMAASKAGESQEPEATQPQLVEPQETESIEETEKTVIELEDMVVAEETPIEEPVAAVSVPKTIEVSIPSGSAVPGCEETDSCYIPSVVEISVGDTVLWKNEDTAAHTVSSGTPSDGVDGKFDSSLFMSGNTYENTFEEAGEYPYFCMVHPWMVGTVQVS